MNSRELSVISAALLLLVASACLPLAVTVARIVGRRPKINFLLPALAHLGAWCANRLRGDAEWIAQRIHAAEPVDLLLLYRARLLAAWSRSRNFPERSGNFGTEPGQDGKNSGQNGKTRDIAGQKRVTSLCNSPPPLTAAPPKEEKNREEKKREENSSSSNTRARAREGGGGGGGRHDWEILRLYAASRPNARSVRELARYSSTRSSRGGGSCAAGLRSAPRPSSSGFSPPRPARAQESSKAARATAACRPTAWRASTRWRTPAEARDSARRSTPPRGPPRAPPGAAIRQRAAIIVDGRIRLWENAWRLMPLGAG